jgi:hypothetical protein
MIGSRGILRIVRRLRKDGLLNANAFVGSINLFVLFLCKAQP